MAITIMGGLFVATVLTLMVVPALTHCGSRVRQDDTRGGPLAIHPDVEAQQTGATGPVRIAAE